MPHALRAHNGVRVLDEVFGRHWLLSEASKRCKKERGEGKTVHSAKIVNLTPPSLAYKEVLAMRAFMVFEYGWS
ncbi:hypothetical protein GCM10027348_05750 [Hymenobacter tenuis]